MSNDYEERGKFFTEVVSKVAIYATLQTTTHMIRGRIHVRHDQRIIDELDLNENFIALTDVSILDANGQVMLQSPFLAVRRTHIVWVVPEKKANEEQA